MRSTDGAKGSGNVLLGLLIAAAIVGLLAVAALRRAPWTHDEEVFESQVREALDTAGEAVHESVPKARGDGTGLAERSTEIDLGWDGPIEIEGGGSESGRDGEDARMTARDEKGVLVVRHLPPPAHAANVLPVRVHLDADGAIFVLTPGGRLQPSTERPGGNVLEIALAGDRRFYTLPDGRLDLELPPSLAVRALEEHVGRGHVRLQVLRPGRLFFAESGDTEP